MMRLRWQLRWDMMAPCVVCALIGTILLLWLGGAIRRSTLEQALARRLIATAGAIAVQGDVFRSPPEDWRENLAQLAAAEDLRISVIAGDGTPLADTALEARQLSNQADRPAIRAAISRGIAQEILPESGRMVVVLAVEQADSGAIQIGPAPGMLLGFVRLSSSLEAISRSVWQWRLGALAIAAAVTGTGVAWIVLVSWRRSRRLVRLSEEIQTSIEGGRRLTRETNGAAATESAPAFAKWARGLSDQIAGLRRENGRLQAESERRRAILDGMAEGVLAIDGEEMVLFANKAAGAFLGLRPGAMLKRPLWESVRLAAIHQAARGALAGGTSEDIEFELPRSATVIALRARPFPDGAASGVVLVLHDITELRRLENIRREFVSNVSHELKTPLASIQAYTETLLEGAIHDEQHNAEFLRRIGEQADRLHHLVLDLLRLARIEAETDVFEIQHLSAAQVIDPCIDDHAALARARGLTIVRDPPEEPLRVRADSDGLRTILDNLLDNALQYTPRGGRVTVRWFRQIVPTEPSEWVCVEVSDTGIGIPPEHLVRIFERFHRVDKARSRELGGTGLGLAIVKHLAQVFGGRVEVDSLVDRGSTFRLFLPAG